MSGNWMNARDIQSICTVMKLLSYTICINRIGLSSRLKLGTFQINYDVIQRHCRSLWSVYEFIFIHIVINIVCKGYWRTCHAVFKVMSRGKYLRFAWFQTSSRHFQLSVGLNIQTIATPLNTVKWFLGLNFGPNFCTW